MAVRRRVHRAAGYRCVACGVVGREERRTRQGYGFPTTEVGVYLSVDHIVHRSRGGTDAPENLRTLCTRCNTGRGTKFDGQWTRARASA